MRFEFEDLLKTIGDNGRYQKLLMSVFFVPVGSLIPVFFLGIIFMNSIPDHWCNVPEVTSSNLSLDLQMLLIRPKSDPFCSTYDVNYTDMITSRNITIDSEKWPTKPCSHGWQFDKTNYDATAVTRWNMVCTDSHYSSLILSMMFAGDCIGTPLFGHLSDKFGRRPVFFLLCAVVAFTEIGSVLIPNFVAFFVLRAINGSVVTVLYISSYITLLELVGTDFRARINGIGTACWTVGLCIIPLVAWLTRNWVYMSIFSSACSLAFLLYWRFLPESPQWLISKGRYEEAYTTLSEIGRINGRNMQGSEDLMKQIKRLGDRMEKEKEENKRYSPLDLLKYKRLRTRFLLITLSWVGNSLPYYGLLVNIKNLWGNEFLNFFLLSVLEFPSHAITWICLEKVGRRWTSVCALLLTTGACLMPTLLPKDLAYIGVVASLLGKLGSSSAYMTLYQQSPELYPTPFRSLGMSLSATIGSASSLSVPFIADLAVHGKHFPFLVFSFVSFIAALCASFLPETLDRTLPQTLEDAEFFGKDDKYFSFNRISSSSATEDTKLNGKTIQNSPQLFKGHKNSTHEFPKGLSFKCTTESINMNS